MPLMTRHRLMARVSAGTIFFGLSHPLDPAKALASTPDMIAAMLTDPEPEQRGRRFGR